MKNRHHTQTTRAIIATLLGVMIAFATVASNALPALGETEEPRHGHVCSSEDQQRISDRLERAETDGGLDRGDADDLRRRLREACTEKDKIQTGPRLQPNLEMRDRVETLVESMRRDTPELGRRHGASPAVTWVGVPIDRIRKIWLGAPAEIRALLQIERILKLIDGIPANHLNRETPRRGGHSRVQ